MQIPEVTENVLKEERIWICPRKEVILLSIKGGADLTLSNESSVMVPRYKAVSCLTRNYKAILKMVLEMIAWKESPGKK